MKLHELLQGIEVLEQNADPELELTGVSYDSRSTAPGELFAAISGYATDGHRFIPAALARGAACVLCEHDMPEHTPWVRVRDARAALAQLGCNWFGHPAERLCMIGVTGTNGKTTVTCLVKHVLEQTLGAKVGLIGTIENRIGDTVVPTERTTPESFALQGLLRQMLDAGCTHVVMEVSSHALALHRVDGIPFTVGAFTNLTEDHLDFHKTMEAYAEAKALLFAQSDAGIVNADDPWAHVMLERAKCPMQTYSAKRNDADLVAKDIRLSASGVRFVAMSGDAIARMRLGIPGMFSVYNALSVIACARALGISLDDCAVTPDAIDNILTTVREFAPARLVFLFGCGGDRDRGKRPKMGRIAGQKADFVIVTSDNPRTEDPEAIIADILPGLKETHTPYVVRPDRREAIAYAIENHCPGDVIILCGKGHEDYQIIGKTKVHMDEREIVAEILDKRKREKEK